VALRTKHHVDEFGDLAARAHYQRVRLLAFVAAFVEVAATGHLKPAPFALDGVQAADVLGDSPSFLFAPAFCFFHAATLPRVADNGCRRRNTDNQTSKKTKEPVPL
jgi:hypothetical protein